MHSVVGAAPAGGRARPIDIRIPLVIQPVAFSVLGLDQLGGEAAQSILNFLVAAALNSGL